jgi:hypothetical protein
LLTKKAPQRTSLGAPFVLCTTANNWVATLSKIKYIFQTNATQHTHERTFTRPSIINKRMTIDAPADPPAFLPPRYPGEDFVPGQFRDAYPSTTPSEPEEYYPDDSRLNASLLVDDDTNLSSLELQEEGGHSLPTAE